MRPSGYSKLPEGVKCRCLELYREWDGSYWCCQGRRQPERPQAAIDNLTNYQVQCDMDGVMVQVSRQALDEVLAYLALSPADNSPPSDETVGRPGSGS